MTRCCASDIGGTWNCVYHATWQKDEPCIAPKDYPCRHKSRSKKREGVALRGMVGESEEEGKS